LFWSQLQLLSSSREKLRKDSHERVFKMVAPAHADRMHRLAILEGLLNIPSTREEGQEGNSQRGELSLFLMYV
jgi:hypothetical protein